jgi:peptidoglycan biosynthesis protein MviN/MurJ (putative lipid II flippase)
LYLLSGLQTGIITSLTFAQQIASLPTHLITNQFSSVVGIKFNELYTKKEFSTLNNIFISTSSFLFFILIPVSGIFFLFPEQITSILLERGSFNKASVTYTASFLKWLGLLLPLIGINTLFARLFMASHKIKESFWYQILFNVALIFALYITVPQFGFIAYPLTLLSIHILNVFFCYFLERYYFKMISYEWVLKKLFIIVLLNIVIGTIVYGLNLKIKVHSSIITVVFGTGLYLVLFTIVGFKLNLDKTFNSFIGQFLERRVKYGRIKNK